MEWAWDGCSIRLRMRGGSWYSILLQHFLLCQVAKLSTLELKNGDLMCFNNMMFLSLILGCFDMSTCDRTQKNKFRQPKPFPKPFSLVMPEDRLLLLLSLI